MSRGARDFSGEDVRKVLVNVGGFEQDRIRVGTLRGIAEDAGAKDFEAFRACIDRNR